jgi:hypothetical protein
MPRVGLWPLLAKWVGVLGLADFSVGLEPASFITAKPFACEVNQCSTANDIKDHEAFMRPRPNAMTVLSRVCAHIILCRCADTHTKGSGSPKLEFWSLRFRFVARSLLSRTTAPYRHSGHCFRPRRASRSREKG